VCEGGEISKNGMKFMDIVTSDFISLSIFVVVKCWHVGSYGN